MKQVPTIECPACSGSGRVKLNGVQLETFDGAKILKTFSVKELWQLINARRKIISEPQVTVTAINNRLDDLHELRLVRRKKDGRAWIYSVA